MFASARVFAGLALALSVLGGGTAEAASAAKADPQAKRIVAAFKDWAARWSVPDGSIAVMVGSTLTGSYGQGAYTAKGTVPVASLSKAITAVCVTQLVESGQVGFTTPLSAVLKKYFKKNAPAMRGCPASRSRNC